MEPFKPTPAALEEFAGVYRSDEMDAVFRITSKGGGLQAGEDQAATGRPGTDRDRHLHEPGRRSPLHPRRRGRVSGFTLEAGRVLGVKFWKDTRPRPES